MEYIGLGKVNLSIWNSKRNKPYITVCEPKNNRPIYSIEFNNEEDRDKFIKKQQHKLKSGRCKL